jgi:hypothetical protein
MKFLEPVQLHTSYFWAGVSDQPASRILPWAKTSLFFYQIYLLPEFLSYIGVTYLSENLRTGAKNC